MLHRFAIYCTLLVSLSAPAFGAGKAAPSAVPASLTRLGQGIDDATLLDENGKTIVWRDLKGQPRALFFGFTHCPVVCPVTVWELDSALLELGAEAGSIKVTFVTLDPARDTPAVLRNYFSGFKGRVQPLSGTQAVIDRIAKSFEVTAQKVNTGNGDYTLDHTAGVYLLDPSGNVVDTLAFGASREVTVTRLRALVTGKK
jgi:protein SCO1/2